MGLLATARILHMHGAPEAVPKRKGDEGMLQKKFGSTAPKLLMEQQDSLVPALVAEHRTSLGHEGARLTQFTQQASSCMLG